MAIISAYHRIVLPPPAVRGIEWGLRARQAMILFRRASGEALIGAGAPNTNVHSVADPYRENLNERRSSPSYGEDAPNTTPHTKFTPPSGSQKLHDYVAIIDLDAQGSDNQYEVIRLPFIPKELEYNSESSFATIKPLGRNNPKYHFTGGEDRLEFEIDWHAFDWGRREVAENCRKIEALSKADGYDHGPHRVKLLWGGENVLFSEHEFIVLAAPYRFTQFNKGNINSKGELESTYMLPIQAYQKVTLGRITRNNLSKIDIEYVTQASPTSIPGKVTL